MVSPNSCPGVLRQGSEDAFRGKTPKSAAAADVEGGPSTPKILGSTSHEISSPTIPTRKTGFLPSYWNRDAGAGSDTTRPPKRLREYFRGYLLPDPIEFIRAGYQGNLNRLIKSASSERSHPVWLIKRGNSPPAKHERRWKRTIISMIQRAEDPKSTRSSKTTAETNNAYKKWF